MTNKFIPLSVPNIRGNEIKYVTEALESEWVSTGGAMIDSFEKHVSGFVNARGAVACQSGTAGLHLALYYFGIQPGDAVIVPTLTFIAAVNPVKYLNAEPIFMDCDESLCMDPQKLKRFLENECVCNGKSVLHKKSKRRIKAIIIVHVFGNMADMETIMSLAEQYNLPVIEDATEALGTYYTEGKFAGKFAGTIGDIGVYSFNGNKIITTGGGGMIVSNDSEKLEKLKYFSTQAKNDPVNFIHDEIGFNYRMTNVQAAIGIAQMERLPEFIKIKKENYELYCTMIDNIYGVSMLKFRNGISPNYWFYSLVLENDSLNRDKIISDLQEKNIQSRPIWGLISKQKPYKNCLSYNISCAEQYYSRVVNLPCSTNLITEEVEYVVNKLKDILAG